MGGGRMEREWCSAIRRAAQYCDRKPRPHVNAKPRPIGSQIMSTFGYYPGHIDYWTFATDWQTATVAILLTMCAVTVACVLKVVRQRPSAEGLPAHESPTIGDDGV